jgi:hypothetical protein
MTTWTSDELKKVGNAEEFKIRSLRGDGTLRKPVTIWVVRLEDDLFVRAVNGQSSAWFRGTQVRREGHISAGGVEKDVTFVEGTGSEINEQIDSEYRSKYRRYAANIVNSVLTPQARGATLKLVPRSRGSYTAITTGFC